MATKADGSIIFETKINTDGFDKGAKEVVKREKDLNKELEALEEKRKKATERRDKADAEAENYAREKYDDWRKVDPEGHDATLERDEGYQALVEEAADADKTVQELEEKIRKVKEELNSLPKVVQKMAPPFDSLVGQVDFYKKKLQDLENAGKSFGDADYDDAYQNYNRATAALQKYKKELIQTEDEAEDLSKTTKSKLNVNLKSLQKYLGQAGKGLSNIGSGLKNMGSKLMGIFKGLGFTIRMFGMSLMFQAFSAITNAVSEGIQSLAQASPTVNQTMTQLTSNLAMLKNSFVSAFAPILTYVEPILTRLMSLLSAVMDKIAQFFSALTGKSTYTKAALNVKDYTKALNGAASAQKQLASFDELNNVSEGGGGGGAVFDPADWVNSEVSTEIATFAEKAKEYLEEVFGDISFEPLKTSFLEVWEDLDLTGETGKKLGKIAEWGIEDFAPQLVKTLGAAGDALITVIQHLEETGVLQMIGDGVVWALQKLEEFFRWIEEDPEAAIETLWFMYNILQMIIGCLTGNWIQAVVHGVITAVSALNGLVESLGELWQWIVDFVTGDWKAGATIHSSSSGRTHGGGSTNFSLRNTGVPMLATGTVVPASYGEFIAGLGDSRYPEVVSPIPTMIEAVKAGTAENLLVLARLMQENNALLAEFATKGAYVKQDTLYKVQKDSQRRFGLVTGR